MKKIVILLTLIMICSPVIASHVTVKIPAVAESSEGRVGVLAELSVDVTSGNGRIFVDTLPLTEIDTQSSARVARDAAENVLNIDLDDYDIFFTIRSSSPIIGGPSAGGAMTVALLSDILNVTIDENIVMTGTINPDGSIGYVGGLIEKAEAVESGGGDLFLIPKGQTIIFSRNNSSELINITEYANNNLNIEIREVSGVTDALEIMTGYKLEERNLSIRKNKILETVMKRMSLRLIGESELLFNITLNRSENEAGILNFLIDKQVDLNESKELFRGEKYYAASSRAFVSLINFRYASNLVTSAESGGNVSVIIKMIDGLKKNIDNVRDKLESKKIDNLIDVEIFGSAAERLDDAYESVRDAGKLIKNGKYNESIYEVSYGTERLNTAIIWIDVMDEFVGDENGFDFQKLRDLIEYTIADANAAIVYASAVGVTSFESEKLLENARNMINTCIKCNTAFASALFSASMARAEITLEMELRGVSDDVILNRIKHYRENALFSIHNSQAIGAEPIMALNYLEYGENLNDLRSSALYLKYASEFSEISKEIYKISNNFEERKRLPKIAPVPVDMEIPVILIGIIGVVFFAGFRLGSRRCRD